MNGPGTYVAQVAGKFTFLIHPVTISKTDGKRYLTLDFPYFLGLSEINIFTTTGKGKKQ
jgi:hypothetical protein